MIVSDSTRLTQRFVEFYFGIGLQMLAGDLDLHPANKDQPGKDLTPSDRARLWVTLRGAYTHLMQALPLNVASQSGGAGQVRISGAPNRVYNFGPLDGQMRGYLQAIFGTTIIQWAILGPVTTDAQGNGVVAVKASGSGALGNAAAGTPMQLFAPDQTLSFDAAAVSTFTGG